jgi:hypothetical protein
MAMFFVDDDNSIRQPKPLDVRLLLATGAIEHTTTTLRYRCARCARWVRGLVQVFTLKGPKL